MSKFAVELTISTTTMALVALEDWMTAVTPNPSKMPLKGVLDSRYRISSG